MWKEERIDLEDVGAPPIHPPARKRRTLPAHGRHLFAGYSSSLSTAAWLKPPRGQHEDTAREGVEKQSDRQPRSPVGRGRAAEGIPGARCSSFMLPSRTPFGGTGGIDVTREKQGPGSLLSGSRGIGLSRKDTHHCTLHARTRTRTSPPNSAGTTSQLNFEGRIPDKDSSGAPFSPEKHTPTSVRASGNPSGSYHRATRNRVSSKPGGGDDRRPRRSERTRNEDSSDDSAKHLVKDRRATKATTAEGTGLCRHLGP